MCFGIISITIFMSRIFGMLTFKTKNSRQRYFFFKDPSTWKEHFHSGRHNFTMSTFEISSKHSTSAPLCGRSMRNYCEYWPKRAACTGVLGGRAVIARRSSQNLERPNWPGKTVAQSESTCSPNQEKRYRAWSPHGWVTVTCHVFNGRSPRDFSGVKICVHIHM